MKRNLLIIAAAAVIGAGSALAFPVTLNVDSSFEGIAAPGQTPLTSGIYRVGWFDIGVTDAQIATWHAGGLLANIENAFNEVFSFTNLNSFGNGLPFETTELVADGDATGLANYRNATIGAANKKVYAWILDTTSSTNATAHAIVTTASLFGAAVDLGGADYETNFATDSFASGISAVVGSIDPVINGGGVDTNGGSAVDGVGLNGGSNVLVLANVIPEPSSALLILSGLGAMALRRRRA